MIRILLTTLLLAFSNIALGECWLVGNLSGQSAKAYAGYRVGADGLSGKSFKITFDGEASSVEPSNGLSCSQASSKLLFCGGKDGPSATIETWAVDASLTKILYTQVRSGYGAMDGNTLFVGEVLGKCK